MSDFEGIAAIMLGKLSAHLAEKGIKLVYGDDVLNLIAKKSYSEKFGARNMRRFIEKNLEDKLASVIIDNCSGKLSGVSLTVENDEIELKTI